VNGSVHTRSAVCVCVCVCVCDVAVRRISLTVGAVEKREVLQILSMCL